VVWKISPIFADWIASPQNIFFQKSILNPTSSVLELGCGVSGVVSLALAPKISKYIATDQGYVLKLLNQNISENSIHPCRPSRGSKGKAGSKHGRAATATDVASSNSNIQAIALDWELDSLTTLPDLLRSSGDNTHPDNTAGLDAVIACDCIYNEALIEPLVRTCAEICGLRPKGPEWNPTVCIIAQQLRSPEVYEAWSTAFHRLFRIWRMPDEVLIEGLKHDSGYVVHVGIPRS